MLTNSCIHPQIIYETAKCGHGSKILITDANYPLEEKTGNAVKVYLGLCPGIPDACDVLKSLLSVIRVESASVMVPETGEEPEIFREFRKELKFEMLQPMSRQDFYDYCMKDGNIALAINTGEERTFANIILTVGVASTVQGKV